jgi:hypothetical protein
MLASLVSGSKNRQIRTGTAAIKISHIENLQPRTGIANPETKVPIAGAQKTQNPHVDMACGRISEEYMSAIEAPPVARQGLPKKPCRKRRK